MHGRYFWECIPAADCVIPARPLYASGSRRDPTQLCMRRQLKLGGKGSNKDPNKPGSNRRLNGDFRGMILERLSGKTLDEELAARRSGVQDVHFLREVLYQVSHSPEHLLDYHLPQTTLCSKRYAVSV